jgi:murein DD-endopeptidase MepM/ murein hydrolase activator NlpD
MDPRRASRPVVPLLLALVPALLVTGLPPPTATAAVDGSWPLRPRPEVVEGFDRPAAPWGPGHRGVDLRGSLGQPVLAGRAGTVSFAGRIAGRGVVVVDHGATRTTYEPVAAEVRVGDRLAEGDRIGTLALFGSHCFPIVCLHWGLLRGDTYLDPLTLVGAGPVRLLPLFGSLPGSRGAPAHPLLRAAQRPTWQPLGAGQLFRP